MRELKIPAKFPSECCEGKDQLEDLTIGGRIMLKKGVRV
jgi:hypothetical protein